jgi:MSHA biogenesis protein MshL
MRPNFRRPSMALILMAGITLLPLGGCDLTKNYGKMDRSSNLQFQDYRDVMSPRPIPTEGDKSASIPPLEPYVSDVPGSTRTMPLVSVAVNQSVPLRDVLYELAKQADFDIELDPRITGSIIFTARNRPFDQVIDRISEMTGLRYKFEDDVVRIELDNPYNVSYKVDYLTAVRTNSSGIQTDVSVVTGEGADTGSSFKIASSSENNFWGELESNLGALLQNNSSENQLRTSSDPTLTVGETLPVADASDSARDEPPPAPGAEGADADATVGGASSADASADDASADDAAASDDDAAAAPAPVVQVGQVAGDDADAGADSAGGGEGGGSYTPTFSINRTAGIITVYASQRLHKEVETYLNELKRQMNAQVLIEAKVLEVALTDEYATGIRWGDLTIGDDRIQSGFGELVDSNFVDPAFGLPTSQAINLISPIPALTNGATANSFNLAYFSGDINVILQAISRYGTVHALASPRLTVLNNQPAVLNVARNQVYFEVDISTTTEDGVTTRDPTAEINSVPIGVLINVVPVMDLDKQTVTMQIRPTVTRIVDEVLDPAVAFLSDDPDLQNRIPVVGVQEIDSVVKMGSGQTLVMGGLLQDRTDSSREGVPVLSELPGIGAAFRTQVDSVSKSELVIFLKATILNDGGLTDTDRDLYRVFGQDRRPLTMQ